jgi:hypothetical protein
LELKRLEAAETDQRQIFQRTLVSKDPIERAGLWRRMINQLEWIGEGISKAVAKLYLHWFKTACLDREAALEIEDESGEIAWNGIMVEAEQLKEWLVRRIIRDPIEQRLNMIRKCTKCITFSEEQQRRLQGSIFSLGQLKMKQFVKMFRKALEFNVFNWTPMVDILHEAALQWGCHRCAD